MKKNLLNPGTLGHRIQLQRIQGKRERFHPLAIRMPYESFKAGQRTTMKWVTAWVRLYRCAGGNIAV